MAISFSQADSTVTSLDFGSIYTGSSSTLKVTIGNSDTTISYTVSAPAQPFSMSPSSATVPAASTSGDGTVDVSIMFAPPTSQSAAATTYSGLFKCTANTGQVPDVAQCNLGGTGVTGLSVSPASVDFGPIPVSDSVSRTVTATNSGSQDVVLSVPSPYSISPSTIAKGSAGVTVTITFDPGQAGPYPGAAADANGVMACSLAGVGVTPTTPTVGDADDFESESPADPSGSTGASNKYYQVTVPDFALNGDTSAGGNSFVRLGSFPLVASWASPTGDASAPTGFQNSLDLANLVGNPALITAVEGSPPAADAVPGTFSDGSGLPSPYNGAADPDYLLGFADDTRLRGTPDDGSMNVNAMAPQTLSAGQVVPNTSANRQEETLRLLTKGGWWDHSDGNRITTTSGDKIEVIQGNYKLVVLGRQPLPESPRSGKGDTDYVNLVDNAFITDVSGGHFQEQYPSPTPCIKTIEYSVDANTGEWTLYQDNTLGNVITKLKGKTVDMFQGSTRESYVGTSSTDNTDTSTGICLDPKITSRTWAQKIETYTGASDKPVPLIYSLTYAVAIEDIKFAAQVTSSTTAGTLALTMTDAPSVINQVGGLAIVSTNTAAVEMATVNAAPFIQTVNACVMEVDFKAGTYYAYGTNKTYMRGNSTTIEGGEEVLSMTANKVRTIENKIADVKNDIAQDVTQLRQNDTKLVQVGICLAQSRADLATDILLGM